MNRCEAPNCKMRTYALTEEQFRLVKNNYVVSFHKFPDGPDRRRSWIDAANKPSWAPPLLNSSLCSLHFRDDCFNENNELYEHAVPSIFFDNFRRHMKEIVEKLDLHSDEDTSKQNSSVESNQSSTKLETDEDISYVECEEIVVYEDDLNVKYGIENISIPELNESAAISTENDALKLPVPMSKLNTSKIDSNIIVDISTSNRSDVGEIKCTDRIGKIANSSTTTNAISSTFLPRDTSNVGLQKTQLENHSPSATKPPSTPAPAEPCVQRSNSVSTTSTSVWEYKPIGVSIKPSMSSGSVVKSALSSPSTPPVSKSSGVQTLSTSSNCSTVLGSTSSSSQITSTFVSPQSNKPANVTSSVSSTTAAETISTPSTSVANKSATISNEPVTMVAISQEKSSSSSTYSILEPATKSLVLQLLNIVKMANTLGVKEHRPGQTYSCYLVTSMCTETDSNEPCEVLPSSTIIDNIANYVRMIKNESFVIPINVSVICGSPAIFLMKNVTVAECDPNLNCVYVVTTENLLPHLCRMKVKSNTDSSLTEQQSLGKPKTNTITSNKPLLVADLVSFVKTEASVPIQNRLNSSPAVNNTSKLNTGSRLSNIDHKLPDNSTTPVSVALAKPSVCTAKPTTNSLSCTTASRTLGNKSIPCSTTAKPVTNSILPEKNSVSSPTVNKPATKWVAIHFEPSQTAYNSISPLNVAKSMSNPIPCSTGPRLPINNSLPRSTSACPETNYSITYAKNNSKLQSSINKPSPNTHVSFPLSVKLSPVRPVSGPAALISKTTLVTSASSTPTATKIVDHSNFAKTSLYSQTSTIASLVVKTALPVTPVSKTLSPIPDTPIARVIPTSVSAAATPLSIQTGSVNFHSKSQSTVHLGTSSQLTANRPLLPMKPTTTLSHTQIPTPPTPVVIRSPLVSPVIRLQPPKSVQMPAAISYSLSSSLPSQPQPSTSSSEPLAFIFQPIQPSNFDTNLKTTEVLMSYDSFAMSQESTSAITSQSTVMAPLKRKWGEIDVDDDEDDDDDSFFADCEDEDYNQQYLEHQKKEIENCESNILTKEREISNLKKRIQALKKRLTAVRNPNDTKTDEQLVEEILSKYLDSDGVQFFIGQMKVSGKTYTQFRWSEDDKLFALGLLYKNPAEYNTLFQKYTLPSDKTLNKFVTKVKKAEMQESKTTNGSKN